MHTMLIIHTTIPSKKDLKKLIKILLESRLCACVQWYRIKSQYIWKNKLCKTKEYVLTAKTLPHCQASIQKLICTHHIYQTPEILCMEAKADLGYFQWLEANIKPKTEI